MKQCKKCQETKPLFSFYVNGASFAAYCKDCYRVRSKENSKRIEQTDPGRKKRQQQVWRDKNPGKNNSTAKQVWRRDNTEKSRLWVASSVAKFKLEFPEEYAAKVGEKAMRRMAAKIQRTPLWSSPEACRVPYRLREETQRLTGIRQAVDHSVPLRGKLVSGLHVPENLVVLSWEDNAQKSNKFDPMTYEWWPECCPKPPHKETDSPLRID